MKKMVVIVTLVVSAALLGRSQAEDSPAVETQPDELFKKLDTNGDGVLTASEIPKEQQKFFERLLRIGDTNKDGKLSREEFDAAMQRTEQPVTDFSKAPGIDAGGAARPNLDPKKIFQALDKNKDGKLTRDEVEGRPRLKALFDRLGKDELTLDDLTKVLGGAGKAKKPGKKFAKNAAKAENMEAEGSNGLPAFARLLDTNHDGRLSREELARAVELFDRLDRNHDGFLDARELTEMPAEASSEGPVINPRAPLARPGLQRANNGAGINLTQLIRRADKDGDGKLSLEEAPKFLKKHFAKIDANGDGFLDREELEAWFGKHRKVAGNAPQGTESNDEAKPQASSKSNPGL